MDESAQKPYSPYNQDPSSVPPIGEPQTDWGVVPPVENPQPTVVIPAQNHGSSILFYLIFILTIIAFGVISYLLFQSFTAKKDTSQPILVVPTVRPTATPIIMPPTAIPTPVDGVLLKLRSLKDSDNTADIEANLNETDLNPLQETVKQFDQKFNFSLKK